MLLELSDYELGEIYALHEMFDEGYFGLTDTEFSFSVSLANNDVNDDSESFGVYSFILHMYNEKIDIDSIDKEQITSIKDTLIASKEFFQSIKGVKVNCDILNKLILYFEIKKTDDYIT